MSTQINIIGYHRQDKVKKIPIEFKYVLNQVKPDHPEILRPARTEFGINSPKSIILLI